MTAPTPAQRMEALLASQLGTNVIVETSGGQQRDGELVELRDGFVFLRVVRLVPNDSFVGVVRRPQRVAVPIDSIVAVTWPEEEQ